MNKNVYEIHGERVVAATYKDAFFEYFPACIFEIRIERHKGRCVVHVFDSAGDKVGMHEIYKLGKGMN